MTGQSNNLMSDMALSLGVAHATVLLLEGQVTIRGIGYPFWFEYDDRDGDTHYEFTEPEPSAAEFDR